MLRAIADQIARIEEQIDAIFRQCQRLRDHFLELQSLPGVGPQTAATLMAHMPELGTLTRR